MPSNLSLCQGLELGVEHDAFIARRKVSQRFEQVKRKKTVTACSTLNKLLLHTYPRFFSRNICQTCVTEFRSRRRSCNGCRNVQRALWLSLGSAFTGQNIGYRIASAAGLQICCDYCGRWRNIDLLWWSNCSRIRTINDRTFIRVDIQILAVTHCCRCGWYGRRYHRQLQLLWMWAISPKPLKNH